jgi:hypothetical protein
MTEQSRSRRRFRPAKIVSGGQTGVDRGALDAAMALGIPHGGWCPKGRLAEDGPIPSIYQLAETGSPAYAERTERNVLGSDATLILCRGRPSGGTDLTLRLARRHARPHLVADLNEPVLARVRRWLAKIRPATLNVAGPRESQAPGIAAQATKLLIQLFSPPRRTRREGDESEG